MITTAMVPEVDRLASQITQALVETEYVEDNGIALTVHIGLVIEAEQRRMRARSTPAPAGRVRSTRFGHAECLALAEQTGMTVASLLISETTRSGRTAPPPGLTQLGDEGASVPGLAKGYSRGDTGRRCQHPFIGQSELSVIRLFGLT